MGWLHSAAHPISKTKKYTFISTGMSSIKHIDDAVNIFRENDCGFELMHCVSTYPMKVEDANLLTINALKKKYILGPTLFRVLQAH